jgi:hypothetical protein
MPNVKKLNCFSGYKFVEFLPVRLKVGHSESCWAVPVDWEELFFS